MPMVKIPNEWITCSDRRYLEELASSDEKIKVRRLKVDNVPGESILEHAVAVRSELEDEFGYYGAFDDVEYTIRTYLSNLDACYILNKNKVLINLSFPKVPKLIDFLTVTYSRFTLPEETGRLHELYIREAYGEVLEADDELTLYRLMKKTGAAWQKSYDQLFPRVLRELIRHESTHSLQKNIQSTLSVDKLKMRRLSPEEFTHQAVNEVLREGFAILVADDYETVIPPAVGEVFRGRLEELFERAAIMPKATYWKYISGLNPAVLGFAGEYLAGTVLKAFGKEAFRKCVTDLNQEEILALHFEACSTLDLIPLFDLSEYPYFKVAHNG